MKYVGPAGFLALQLFLYAPHLWPEPEFHSEIKPQSVKVGELAELDLEAAWKNTDADYKFGLPSFQLENLSLEESGETNETFEKAGEEWRRKVFRFRLRATEKGKGRVRPFQVTYLDPTSIQSGRFEVQELEVSIHPDRTKLFQSLAAAVAIGLGIFGIWWFVQKSKKEPQEAVKELTLEERYLSQMNNKDQKIPDAGRSFRTYLTEKFSLPSGKTTPREILGLLESRVSPEELKKLRKIFDKLDECQFGTAARSQAEHRELHLEMTQFVEGKMVI